MLLYFFFPVGSQPNTEGTRKPKVRYLEESMDHTTYISLIFYTDDVSSGKFFHLPL